MALLKKCTDQFKSGLYLHDTLIVARFVVYTAMVVMIQLCWDDTHFPPDKSCRRFEGPYFLHVQILVVHKYLGLF